MSRVPVDGLPGHPDVCVIELGGTVGDIESMPFVEALRQFQFRVGLENMCFMHASLIPLMGDELKTKPTQHSVRELRSLGLQPDFIMCRSSVELDQGTKNKLSSFCHVPGSHVIGVHNVPNLYTVPVLLRDQGVDRLVLERLKRKYDVGSAEQGFRYWKEMEEKSRLLASHGAAVNYKGKGFFFVMVFVLIRVLGFFLKELLGPRLLRLLLLESTPICKMRICPSQNRCSMRACRKVAFVKFCGLKQPIWKRRMRRPTDFSDQQMQYWFLEDLESEELKVCLCLCFVCFVFVFIFFIFFLFSKIQTKGMILACQYARENNIPYLGICLGFQIAVIEFARNVLGWAGSNSTEFDARAPYPVVIFMPEGNAEIKVCDDVLCFCFFNWRF